MHFFKIAISIAAINILTACQTPPESGQDEQVAANLMQQAKDSTLAFEIVESLTVEVGPRMAGSPEDVKAVNWAMDKLQQLGFNRIYKEPVQVPVWHRGEAKAQVISPYPQNLVITALGGSVATPIQGITAEIVRFDSLEQLKQANPDLINNKIVFIDHATEKSIDGHGYGETVAGRSKGAIEAAKKGAVAVLIRSIGTDHDRMAHTGMMRYSDNVEKIPAAALSIPDANQLNLMLKRSPSINVKLEMSPSTLSDSTSYNVIAEVTGSSLADEIVLIGAHLDSWDQGTGAIDDGAGVAIVTAAAKLILDLPQPPKRTIRVVLYAAEEIGLVGGKAYAKAHQHELAKHYIAAESDFGAGKIYQIDVNVAEVALKPTLQWLNPMTKNNIVLGNNQANGGPDVSMLPKQGVPVASLRQDGTDYFDYHHTPNDTLDKIDPKALAQNVAAYAQFAYLMAQSEMNLRPIQPETK